MGRACLIHPTTVQSMRQAVMAGFAAIFVLPLAGCGSVAKQGTISGVVKLDGKPVSGGFISFTLADGLPHTVDIQGDGSYRVEGIPVGEAIITVTSPPVDDQARQMHIKLPTEAPPPPPKPRYPDKYADMGTSDLRYVIQPGENTYNVEMKR